MITRITFGDRPGSGPRPQRAARCLVLPELTPDPFADVVTIEWFDAPPEHGDILADAHVLRGGDWLEERWHTGGDRFTHLAFARRAAGLTVAEFSQRWRGHAGSTGGSPIPDEAKGLAYVQNHPVPRSEGEWRFDAVNQVWFDDLDGLRRRVEWFRENHDPSGDDLFGPSSFLAAREVVLT